jgi:hypothetical protein
MPTILWNPRGFHVVIILHPRALFNAPCFTDGNLVPLVEKFSPVEWSGGQKKLVVQIDNAPGDNSRMAQNFLGRNPLKELPHPVYSPDISLWDFYLFGKVKSTLIR